MPGGLLTEPQPASAMPHQQRPDRAVRILAVDDSAANLMVLATFLKHPAIAVQLADGGADGIEAFKACAPDLVFMDLSMPDIDGFMAAAAIRDHERAHGWTRTPIVALTAFAVDSELQGRIAVSMDGHLSKPVRKQDLLRIVHAWTAAASPQP
jgi:CheY-like chemotaxis protein